MTQKSYRKTKNSRIIVRMIAIIVLLVTIGSLQYFLIFHSKFFRVKSIQVEGIDQIEETVILEMSGIDYNDQSFGFKLSDIEQLIEKHPYVQTASVRRKKLQHHKYCCQRARRICYNTIYGILCDVR